MNFIGPLRAHEHSIKTNPLPTLISDAIILAVVVAINVIITVLVWINEGFNPILLLSWFLLGGISVWLIVSIVRCTKNLKRIKEKEAHKKTDNN